MRVLALLLPRAGFSSPVWCEEPVSCIFNSRAPKHIYGLPQPMEFIDMLEMKKTAACTHAVDAAAQSGPPLPTASPIALANGVPKVFLGQKEVTAVTTMSRSAIYEAMRSDFPHPVKLSDQGRRVAWKSSEVLAWCESRTKTCAATGGGQA